MTENTTLNNNLSHNIDLDDNKITLKNLPNYLIVIEKHFEDKNTSEILCANCVTQALDIATSQGRICAIYRLNGSMGKSYIHYADVSDGVY